MQHSGTVQLFERIGKRFLGFHFLKVNVCDKFYFRNIRWSNPTSCSHMWVGNSLWRHNPSFLWGDSSKIVPPIILKFLLYPYVAYVYIITKNISAGHMGFKAYSCSGFTNRSLTVKRFWRRNNSFLIICLCSDIHWYKHRDTLKN